MFCRYSLVHGPKRDAPSGIRGYTSASTGCLVMNRQGVFEQVPSASNPWVYEPLGVWYAEVDAANVQLVLRKIRDVSDPIDVAHLKRVTPKVSLDFSSRPKRLDLDEFAPARQPELHTTVSAGAASNAQMKPSTCSSNTATEPRSAGDKCREKDSQSIPLLVLLGSQAVPREAFPFVSGIKPATAPRRQAPSKEIAAEWSARGWPLLWRGNPAAAPRKLSAAEQSRMERRVAELGSTSHTIIEYDGIKVAEAFSSAHPLGHSVMVALERVARDQRAALKAGRKPSIAYLCSGATVYTFVEPCTMCSMALVHSRIARLVFVQPNSQGGLRPNSALGYGLHQITKLNHCFDVWQYCGASNGG